MIQTDLSSEILEPTVSSGISDPQWTLWSLCSDGCYMMIPLFVMLLLLIAVFLYRAAIIGAGCRHDNLFIDKIKDLVHDNEIESAENLCRKASSPSARIIREGLRLLGMPVPEICSSLRFTIEVELANLRMGIGWIRFIAYAAPVLGLFGTIAGMVSAGYTSPGQSLDMLICAPSVTFASGLGIGILAAAAYEYLCTRINRAKITLNSVCAVFLGLLNEPAA